MPRDEPAAPTTILFTDLVESTALLQREGDENAQRIFRAHRRLLADAVRRHGGREVKWLGDGLMVAFASPGAAVRCAVEMQQAAQRPGARERLGVRIGLHVGETLRDEEDYFGTAVVVARRICDSGESGQILCSSLVAGLLFGRRDFTFADRGPQHLKGIASPVQVFEVVYAPPSTPRIALLADAAAARRGPGRRAWIAAAVGGGVLALAAAAVAAAAVLSGGGEGDDGRGAGAPTQAAVAPTPQLLAAESGCGAPGSATCRGVWTITPEIHEGALWLAFVVTFRSDTDCTASWRSDRTESLRRFAEGDESEYVVVDVTETVHRMSGANGLADLTLNANPLPCNSEQYGAWKFGEVPPGDAQFHYPDFAEPINFRVPDPPPATPATP